MRPLERLGNDVAHCTAFLTRLPVPSFLFRAPLDFARSGWAIPLAGLPVALLAVFPALAASVLGSSIGAILFLLVSIVSTGGLHEDGLADCADGFWGASDQAARLAIMRRSDIGTYGTLALIGAFTLRTACLAKLFLFGSFHTVLAVVLAAVLARVALMWHWNALGSARTAGGTASLSDRFGQPSRRATHLWSAVLLAVGTGTAIAFDTPSLLTAFAFAAVATFVVGRLARRKIGGRTGDTLGATVVVAETAFLLGVIVPIGWP